jgi:hypothetical protein
LCSGAPGRPCHSHAAYSILLPAHPVNAAIVLLPHKPPQQAVELHKSGVPYSSMAVLLRCFKLGGAKSHTPLQVHILVPGAGIDPSLCPQHRICTLSALRMGRRMRLLCRRLGNVASSFAPSPGRGLLRGPHGCSIYICRVLGICFRRRRSLGCASPLCWSRTRACLSGPRL